MALGRMDKIKSDVEVLTELGSLAGRFHTLRDDISRAVATSEGYSIHASEAANRARSDAVASARRAEEATGSAAAAAKSLEGTEAARKQVVDAVSRIDADRAGRQRFTSEWNGIRLALESLGGLEAAQRLSELLGEIRAAETQVLAAKNEFSVSLVVPLQQKVQGIAKQHEDLAAAVRGLKRLLIGFALMLGLGLALVGYAIFR
jgi:hypothetical protein